MKIHSLTNGSCEDVREFDQTNTTKKTSRKVSKQKCWLDDDDEDEMPYTSVKLPKNVSFSCNNLIT